LINRRLRLPARRPTAGPPPGQPATTTHVSRVVSSQDLLMVADVRL